MRMFFQITMDYGPLASKSSEAYPMTSEAKKVEEARQKENPVPPHIANLFVRSTVPLKRALLFETDLKKVRVHPRCLRQSLTRRRPSSRMPKACRLLIPRLPRAIPTSCGLSSASSTRSMVIVVTVVTLGR